MKQGFGLLVAISFIIIVSIFGVVIVNNSKINTGYSEYLYVKNQAKFIIEGAKALALNEWLNSNPASDTANRTGIYTNTQNEIVYYYPNPSATTSDYKITIKFNNFLDNTSATDNNTVEALITLETINGLAKFAPMRLNTIYFIGN